MKPVSWIQEDYSKELQVDNDITLKLHDTYQRQESRVGSFVHGTNSCLVTRVDQSISQDDIFPSPGSKNHDLSDVFWSQRLTATIYRAGLACVSSRKIYRVSIRINRVCLDFVAPKSHKREFLLWNCKYHGEQGNMQMGKYTVSTWPGSISITRILVAISSFLRLSVKLRTAALLAQYILPPA